MSRQGDKEQQLDLVSQDEQRNGLPHRVQAERLQDRLSQFIETEYHEVLLSDANFVPAQLQQRSIDLSARLQQQVLRQSELTQTINDLEFELKRLDAQIEATRKTQTTLKQARRGDAVSKKESAMRAAEKSQEEQQGSLELAVRAEKLKGEVERKRRTEEAVLARLRDQISKEEGEIAQWQKRIAELQAKIQNERGLGNLPGLPSERMRETEQRLVYDRRAAVQASIARLKEYVKKYGHLISP